MRKPFIILFVLLTDLCFSKAQLCQISLSSLDHIQDAFEHHGDKGVCYLFESSKDCVMLYNKVDHKSIMLNSSYIAIKETAHEDWKFQKRSQLGFYTPWIKAVEMAIRGEKVRGKNCILSNGMRKCRFRLDTIQSLVTYQISDKNILITDFSSNQGRHINKWVVTGNPVNSSLICPNFIGVKHD